MTTTQITLFEVNAKDSLPRFKPYISAAEWAHCLRFNTPLLQLRYAATRALLRKKLSQKTGVCPMALQFEFNKYKKPQLKDNDDWYFSISHSQNTTAIAVASAPIGIDIEHTTVLADKKMIPLFIRNDESKLLQSEVDFYQLWCIKEAILKAVGTGFYTDPLRFQLLPLTDHFFETYLEQQHYVAHSLMPIPGLQLAISQPNGLDFFCFKVLESF